MFWEVNNEANYILHNKDSGEVQITEEGVMCMVFIDLDQV